ncbi:MAG: hypothetical protein ACLTTU_11105 [Bilophila wadsworthia]
MLGENTAFYEQDGLDFLTQDLPLLLRRRRPSHAQNLPIRLFVVAFRWSSLSAQLCSAAELPLPPM